MGALSKLFGKSEGGEKVLSEVQEAQEAAIKASGKKPTPKVKPTITTEEFVPVAESSGKPPGKPPKKPPTPKEEPKFGREAITPEDTFTQAWKKLTPTQMVSEVGAIIKSMRGSLDLPMLRQGKIMTVDFLTTGNAKELANALRQSKDVTFGKKTMDQLNAEHAADPITRPWRLYSPPSPATCSPAPASP